MDKFNHVVKRINKANEIILVISIVIMFVILLAQIFVRFLFFIPLPASQDLLTFFMIASVFFGSGIAVANGKQIALELVIEYVPENVKNIMIILADCISITFLVIIMYQSIVLIEKCQGTIVGASPIPLSVYYMVVCIGCLFMMLNFANQIGNKLKAILVKEVS